MALGQLWVRIAEAYTDPRASARRILGAGPTWTDAISMVMLALSIQLSAQIIATNLTAASGPASDTVVEGQAAPTADEAPYAEDGTRRASDAPSAFAAVFRSMGAQFMVFLGVSFLGWFIGAQFGGRAGFDQVAAVVGWHTLASLPIELILLVALVAFGAETGGLTPLLILVGVIYILYLFAAFLSEAHGFQQVGVVMAASFGVLVGVGFISMLVLTMLGVLEPP